MIERIEINLLPAEYRFHRTEIRIPREVIYPLFVIALAALLIAMFSVGLQSRIGQLQGQTREVEHQIALNKPIQGEIRKYQQDKRAVQEKIRALERISVNREKWVRLMEVFSDKLPDFTWLVSLKEQNNTTPSILALEGRTFSFPEVANFMSRLKESEYISAVDLADIEQIDPKDKIFKFSISCTINPDAQLDTTRLEESVSGR